MAIIVVFAITWGIIQYSLLYPPTDMVENGNIYPIWTGDNDIIKILNSVWLLVRVLRDTLLLPFWQMFTQFYMDNLIKASPYDLPESSDWCTNDPVLFMNYTLPRCPDLNTSWLIPFFLIGYALITNLLIFNLLIAIFNNTYQEIQGNRAHVNFKMLRISTFSERNEAKLCNILYFCISDLIKIQKFLNSFKIQFLNYFQCNVDFLNFLTV